MDASCGPGNLLELQEDKQLAELVKDWNFRRGKGFEDCIFSRFRSPIHHPSSSPRGASHLLAVFRRYTFHLTETSVSLALHFVLGGALAGFHVTLLKDWHFCFSVASKFVGCVVCDLKHIVIDQFDVYFHLWRDGGADWIREWNKWQEEERASWQQVSHRKRNPVNNKRVSFATKLVQDSPMKKPTPKETIHFGDFICQLDAPCNPSQKPIQFASSVSNSAGEPSQKPSKPSSSISNSNPQQPIPAKTVFARLRKQLGVSNQQAVEVRNASTHAARATSQLCFRCLGLGHLIRDCKNPVRCKFCFNYGHLQRSCFKWRTLGRSKWTPKRSPSSSAKTTEPHTVKFDKTGGEKGNKPSPSFNSLRVDSASTSFPDQDSSVGHQSNQNEANSSFV
jgi:hypothetical protein